MNAGVGAYASLRNVPADKLLALPDDISCEDAAAVLFKGMTAQYLLHKTHRVRPGDVVLVHAAAGGVGQILCRRSEEHTSELQSLMRITYAVFCLKKKNRQNTQQTHIRQ